MDVRKPIQTVVQGEASESDDDDTAQQTQPQVRHTVYASSVMPVSAVVVSGEAPESDDEEEEIDTSHHLVIPPLQVVISGEASESDDEEEESDTSHQLVIPPLQVNTANVGDKGDITNIDPGSSTPVTPTEPVKQKYNSLLHKKLRERNQALRRHLVDTVQQMYTAGARDLHNNTLQLQKTHIAIQDVSHHMRLTTNDLFHLEDKVDIVRTCNILPDINIPSPGAAINTGLRAAP